MLQADFDHSPSNNSSTDFLAKVLNRKGATIPSSREARVSATVLVDSPSMFVSRKILDISYIILPLIADFRLCRVFSYRITFLTAIIVGLLVVPRDIDLAVTIPISMSASRVLNWEITSQVGVWDDRQIGVRAHLGEL